MSTTSERTISARPAIGWLKAGLAATVLFAACWGGSISFWRVTQRAPATGDLVVYLLVLPSVLLLALWVGVKAIHGRGVSKSATQSPANPANMGSRETTGLAIVAASIRTPHGASCEELISAIRDHKARADLVPELLDQDGFPVMAARCAEADDDALHEEIRDWLGEHRLVDLRFKDEQLRALTLAGAVAGELGGQATSLFINPTDAPIKLQLLPMLPPEWSADERRAAGMWIKRSVAQTGWPADHIILAAEPATDDSTASILDRVTQETAARDLVTLVLASASNIGDHTIAEWAANGTLFTSAYPRGTIPGEGAAGLLVTSARHAQAIKGNAFSLLDGLEEAKLPSSADVTRRVDRELLGQLAERSLKRGGVESSRVTAMVADTGHRSNRMIELMGPATSKMPQLDESEDVIRVGGACGTCGAVPVITSLALAQDLALLRQAPVLVIGNEDSYIRITAVIHPATSLATGSSV
jgi:hypothetical protein